MWGEIHPSAKYGTKIQNLGLLLRVGDKQSKWGTNNKRRKIMSKNGINIKRIGLTSKVEDIKIGNKHQQLGTNWAHTVSM